MSIVKKIILPIFLSTIWISILEFGRNELLFKDYWINHYQSMGLEFPSEPINGAMWGLWAVVFSVLILIISRKFNLLQTTLISWFFGFVMMWIVIGNLNVLPFSLLYIAVPASLLEAFGASFILTKLSKRKS
jgi:hypothetical protein